MKNRIANGPGGTDVLAQIVNMNRTLRGIEERHAQMEFCGASSDACRVIWQLKMDVEAAVERLKAEVR